MPCQKSMWSSCVARYLSVDNKDSIAFFRSDEHEKSLRKIPLNHCSFLWCIVNCRTDVCDGACVRQGPGVVMVSLNSVGS